MITYNYFKWKETLTPFAIILGLVKNVVLQTSERTRKYMKLLA